MFVFYSHPVSLYHTKQEEEDLILLNDLFPHYGIINPSEEWHQKGYAKDGMKYFLDIIKADVDILAFRRFPNGKIGAGVWKEIKQSMEGDILIFELPTIKEEDVLTVAETKEYLNGLVS
jgi:hypothetical protein